MKNIITTALMVLITLTNSYSQYQKGEFASNPDYYMNPIFPGDYPDPSIIRDGEDYYMVHSSFDYYPGLTIWHSRDLINWEPITNALNQYIGAVWAPDLVKYNKRYYIYIPAENTNYVIHAEMIEGPWSEPINLNIEHIDPGHVSDKDGKRYLYFSSGAYIPLSDDGLSVAGELKHVYDGWPIPPEWSIECFCMEGPKLFQRGDYYYLTMAQGGTAGPATGHMVISARSKSPLGPWENSPYNPIIRTQSPDEPWWSVGHATIFDEPNGNTWMLFHGYERDYYNKGRQTLMLPLEWTADNWYKLPEGSSLSSPQLRPSGMQNTSTFSLSDPFNTQKLNIQWKFFEDFREERYSCSSSGITIKGKGSSISNSAPLLTVPLDHSYSAQVEMEIEGDAIGGLVLFYNQQASSGILADSSNILSNLRGWEFVTETDVHKRKVFLKLQNNKNTVDMYYSLDGEEWLKTENSFEVSAMHHNVLSGFLSLRIGLVAIGDGQVTFRNFIYKAL